MTISDDDAKLFRLAIGPVRPLKQNNASALVRRPVRPRLLSPHRQMPPTAELTVPTEPFQLTADDLLSYRKHSVHPHIFQRLKKGVLASQDEIDLHGATVMQAEILLLRFLANAQLQGYRCVRIIHGKGRQSESAYPALKNLVNRLLRRDGLVLAFHSATRAQGGSGAVCVLLSRRHT